MTTAAACEGATSGDATGCTWDAVSKSCNARQQSLRYGVVDNSIYPKVTTSVSGANIVVKVNKDTGEMSISSDAEGSSKATKPNYENLIFPDEEVHCDLGAPVRSGDGTESNPYKWIGRFPNGVEGICRMFNNDLKKKSGKKEKHTFLDAGALCASGGGRLPTLSELVKAAAHKTSVVASGTATAKDGEPSSPDVGGGSSRKHLRSSCDEYH